MLKELFDPRLFRDLGAVNLGLEHETFGIYQQMALPTIDLFSAVAAAFLSTDPTRLDRLGVHYPGALG
jgi:hypothetical protein